MALGCNMFNLGFFPAFVAYPLIYRVIAGAQHGTRRAWVAAMVAGVAGLQLGAFSVVLETKVSGISELPFGTFLLMMLPIHLAIGLVEGLATAAVVSFVARARPEAVQTAPATEGAGSIRPVIFGLAIAAVVMGGVASWFASTHPDGLEWSIAKVSSKDDVAGAEESVHKNLAEWQKKTAFLPDYGFKSAQPGSAAAEHAAAEPEPWPAVKAGTSVAGLVGGLMTLTLACVVGMSLTARAKMRAR
jgi:cobalt/nickel transport system permease protein